MKMMDDGFEEKAKERKKQKLKMLEEKGLLKQRSKRKRNKEFVEKGNKPGKVEVDALSNIASPKKKSKKRK
jgi:ATP-dependent RNA helicase DDX49/DBP8